MTDLEAAVRTACERRRSLHQSADQTAYRLFHGYAEGKPGLTIDRYGDVVLLAHKVDVADELDGILAGLDAGLDPLEVRAIVAKAHRHFNWDASALSVTSLRGELPREPVEVRDNGLTLLATPHANESNGLFLDARPIRGWLRANSEGRRVLNLFAYTGSLGVAAAAGGARSVVHVDKKKNPLALARDNHRLNDLEVDNRGFLTGDVYQHLPRAARGGAEFDAIILDPPPRVPGQKRGKNPDAQDFARLTQLTTRLLAPGGWLLCFFHRFDRTRAEFEAEVRDHAECPLEVLWRGTSGEDFPEENPEHKLRVTAFARPPE